MLIIINRHGKQIWLTCSTGPGYVNHISSYMLIDMVNSLHIEEHIMNINHIYSY
jgi:hypothetical protein